MSVEIYVKPDDIWDFFFQHKTQLEDAMACVADNSETSYRVLLTESSDLPLFVVTRNDKPEYKEGAVSERDCAETAHKCYTKYLFPVTVTDGYSTMDEPEVPEPEPEVDENLYAGFYQSIQDSIYERDDDLLLAFCEFLHTVLQVGRDGSDIRRLIDENTLGRMMDECLDVISDGGNYSIYRPMLMTDGDTGEDVYMTYPYDPAESGVSLEAYILDNM